MELELTCVNQSQLAIPRTEEYLIPIRASGSLLLALNVMSMARKHATVRQFLKIENRCQVNFTSVYLG